MEGLGRYLESSQLADVEVEADGRVFPAHRIVLARHSLLLRQIFEALAEDEVDHRLPLRLVVSSPGTRAVAEPDAGKADAAVEVELPPGAWPLVASFMYEGAVLLHPNNVLPLFDSAVRLKIPGLHAQCTRFLTAGTGDIVGLAASAGQWDLAAAEEHCLARIARDLPTLVRSDAEGFSRLAPAQLLRLFRRPDLNTEGNEYLLWHLLVRWTQANLPPSLALGDRRPHSGGDDDSDGDIRSQAIDDKDVDEAHDFLREALTLIRFALFTSAQLALVQRNALVTRLLPEGYFLQVYAHKLELQQFPTAITTAAAAPADSIRFLPRTPPPWTAEQTQAGKASSVVVGQVVMGAMDQSFLWRIHSVRETLGLDDYLSTSTRTFRSPSFVLDGSRRQFVLGYNAMERSLRLYIARSRAVSDFAHGDTQLPPLVDDSDSPLRSSSSAAPTHYVAIVHPQSSHESITQEVTPQSAALRVALVDLTSQGFIGRAEDHSDVLLIQLLSVSLPSRSSHLASHLTDAINEEDEDVSSVTEADQRTGSHQPRQQLEQAREKADDEAADFMRFFLTEKLADVTLRLVDENGDGGDKAEEEEGEAKEGRTVKEVKAHRLLLCCGSDYFDSMFGSPWSEALTSEVCIPLAPAVGQDEAAVEAGQVELEKDEVDMFVEMIASFYGKAITPNEGNVLSLLKISLRFLAHSLSESCLAWLREEADVEQLFLLLLRANRLDLAQAQECLLDRLASEFGSLVHRGQLHLFEQLPYDQLLEFVQRDQLYTLNEYQVWSVVSHYINTHGHELHESETACLLRAVRYPLLTSSEILQVAQNKLVSGDHIQTALAFRLAHHEEFSSSVVAYGQGPTKPRSRDGLWCFTVPGIERLLDAERRRKQQRKEHKRLEAKAHNPALINVYYDSTSSSASTEASGSGSGSGRSRSKRRREKRLAATTIQSETFVDRQGCSWTLRLFPEYRQGQQYVSLEVEFYPPASAAQHQLPRHRLARPDNAGRIEEAQLSKSAMAQRFSATFTGRVLLQFVTQSPFQLIKREFPFVFRYPNERVEYTQLFTLADLRSLRLIDADPQAPGRDTLTIQFEVRLDPSVRRPASLRDASTAAHAAAAAGLYLDPSSSGSMQLARVRFRHHSRRADGEQADVEEAEFVCEVVDKTQLPAVLASYGVLPYRRGLMLVVGGRERRDTRVDSLQIRGARDEVDVLFVDSKHRIVDIERRVVYAAINAGDSCYVFIVNNRDRCALLPHLSASGDTAELAPN